MEKYFRVCIDKLEFTYSATNEWKEDFAKHERYNIGGLYFERKKHCRYYQNEYSVFYDDYEEKRGEFPQFWGYLCYGSSNDFRQNVYFLFDNKALYSDLAMNARYYLEDVLNIEFRYISKLDIAVDFNFKVSTCLMKAYKNLDYNLIINDKCADDSKVDGVGVYAGNNPRKRLFAKPELIFSNSDKSSSLKVYDKRREIDESSNKDYIIKDFQHKSVYRAEVSMKNRKIVLGCISACGIDEEYLLCHLLDEDLLQWLFVKQTYKLIHFTHRKNRKIYDFFSLGFMCLK